MASSAKDQAKRAKLLELLGAQEAFVLGGHIHKFNRARARCGMLMRAPRAGAGLPQLALQRDQFREAEPKDVLSGIEQYNGDQIRVEPQHSPGTEEQWRARNGGSFRGDQPRALADGGSHGAAGAESVSAAP